MAPPNTYDVNKQLLSITVLNSDTQIADISEEAATMTGPEVNGKRFSENCPFQLNMIEVKAIQSQVLLEFTRCCVFSVSFTRKSSRQVVSSCLVTK